MEGVGYPICESSRSQMLIMLMLSWEMCLLCQQLSWFIVSLQLNFSLFSVDHDLSLSHSKEPFGILLVIPWNDSDYRLFKYYWQKFEKNINVKKEE